MSSTRSRLQLGFGLLTVLLVGITFARLLVTEHVVSELTSRTGRLEQARHANAEVLQGMTDAETGIRGYQLTARDEFLDPYRSGVNGVWAALARVRAAADREGAGDLLRREETALKRWLSDYADPIVAAGPGTAARAVEGKRLFDEVRAANAAVEVRLQIRRDEAVDAAHRFSTTAELLFVLLALGCALLATALALSASRQLLAPLDRIRHTLDRLAAGDRSARARADGPAEVRAVIRTLNALAAETERLIGAEQARAARTELQHTIGTRVRGSLDEEEILRTVTGLLGPALDVDAVHAYVPLETGTALTRAWPPGTPELPAATLAAVRAELAGDGVARVGAGGDVAALVELNGTAPGLVCLLDRTREWKPEELQLLDAVVGELRRALHQARLYARQTRLVDELRALDERKDAFVSTVSHELRTPLTSILGYCELMEDGETGPLVDPQRRALAAIIRNAHRLRATVGDLLLAGTRTSRPRAEHAAVDLSALARTVHADLQPLAAGKGLCFTLRADVPVWVAGDPAQLERLLLNLVNNATKFTPAGGAVTVTVQVDGSGAARLAVADTGIGIPPDDVPWLFTPFSRAANAIEGAVQGTGLGLAITRAIVDEHGGSVRLRSELDRGTEFVVTLPRCDAPVTTVPEQGERALLSG